MNAGPLIACAIVSLLPGAVLAAPDKYQFDKDHTHVLFFVNHEGFSDLPGRIREFSGYFTFDEKEPEKSTLDVTLDAASIDTDVPELNKVLNGPKFLNTARFPTMHFQSTSVTVYAGLGGQNIKPTADVTGTLTLLGVTKPVTLHVTYHKSGIHPFTNNYVSGFSADAIVRRSDFGMTAYLGDVGDEVRVHIEAEGTDPLKHPGNSKAPH